MAYLGSQRFTTATATTETAATHIARYTGWGKIKYSSTKIAISKKCLNIFALNFAHLYVRILCTNALFCVVFTWNMSNWRKHKLQERISQLNKKLISLLKQLSNKYHVALLWRHYFYVYVQHSIIINSSVFQAIIAVWPLTLVMGKNNIVRR